MLRRWCRTLVLSFLLVGLVPEFLAGEDLFLATGEQPPLTSAALPEGGPLTQVVVAAAAASGFQARVEWFPWARTEFMVSSGQAAAAFGYSKNPDRERTYLFTKEPILLSTPLIFYVAGRGNDLAWSHWQDFKGKRFAGVLGWWYLPILAENGITTESAPNERLAFMMLKADRVDYVIMGDTTGVPLIREVFGDELPQVRTLANPARPPTPSYLILSRENPRAQEIADRLDSGLRAIKQSGLYRKLMAPLQLQTTPTTP